MEKTQYPYDWEDISPEERSFRGKLHSSLGEASLGADVVRSKPGGMVMTRRFRAMAESVYNFEVRKDDIWIVTYPKCGTTWTQETVWQILQGVDPASSRTGAHLTTRSPFLELSCLVNDSEQMKKSVKEQEVNPFADSITYAKNKKSPRIIKTHMPFEMLPQNLLDTAKVIYVCRNVSDVCCSWYHHHVAAKESYAFDGTFQQYAEMFMGIGPVYGDYWKHLKSALKVKDHPNMCMVWYEEMKKDHRAALEKLTKFLDRPLSEEKLEQLQDHLTVSNMRDIAKYNATGEAGKAFAEKFYRKGVIGDSKKMFAETEPEFLMEWEKWVEQNLAETKIDMVFE